MFIHFFEKIDFFYFTCLISGKICKVLGKLSRKSDINKFENKFCLVTHDSNTMGDSLPFRLAHHELKYPISSQPSKTVFIYFETIVECILEEKLLVFILL